MRGLVELFRARKFKVTLCIVLAAVAAGASLLTMGSPDPWQAFLPYATLIGSGVTLASVPHDVTTEKFPQNPGKEWKRELRLLAAAMGLFFVTTFVSVTVVRTFISVDLLTFGFALFQCVALTFFTGVVATFRASLLRPRV